MTGTDYPACLRELIESEIFGESFSLALLEEAKADRDYYFATLLQLETETKARLRPLLYTYAVPLSEIAPTEQIEEIVKWYLTSSWEEIAAANTVVVQNFLNRFQEIAAAGPAEDRDWLESMVRDERAMLRWFDMESRVDREGSLDAMIDELQYPLAPSER